MPIPPLSTPAPRPEQLFMPGISYQIEAPASAAPTPLPERPGPEGSGDQAGAGAEDSQKPLSASSEQFKLAKLRLEIRDLSHAGASLFLSSVNASQALETAMRNVLRYLYVSPSTKHFHPPPTRSVTVILRDMGGGVAYTTGSDLDDDHKEIHLHLGYVAGQQPPRAGAEIDGVLTHELVHCLQWNAHGTAPGGLIEGIADWVRLRCGLAPPHWQRPDASNVGDKWDQGYQHTAYFLDYLERRFGIDTVRHVNESLRTTPRYDEKDFWTSLVGRPVEQLWGDYKESLKEEQK